MPDSDGYEFFDPRQVRPADEEKLMPLPEAPDLTPRAAPKITEEPAVRIGSDKSVIYHKIEQDRTPLPAAWLALVGGLLLTISVFLPWTHIALGTREIGIQGYDLSSYGPLVLFAGAGAVALGLASLVTRKSRLPVFCWLSGLTAAAAIGHVFPKLFRSDYSYSIHGQSVLTSDVSPGPLALLVLGTVIVFLAALWASQTQRIGK
jgi:hypothetical protein